MPFLLEYVVANPERRAAMNETRPFPLEFRVVSPDREEQPARSAPFPLEFRVVAPEGDEAPVSAPFALSQERQRSPNPEAAARSAEALTGPVSVPFPLDRQRETSAPPAAHGAPPWSVRAAAASVARSAAGTGSGGAPARAPSIEGAAAGGPPRPAKKAPETARLFSEAPFPPAPPDEPRFDAAATRLSPRGDTAPGPGPVEPRFNAERSPVLTMAAPRPRAAERPSDSERAVDDAPLLTHAAPRPDAAASPAGEHLRTAGPHERSTVQTAPVEPPVARPTRARAHGPAAEYGPAAESGVTLRAQPSDRATPRLMWRGVEVSPELQEYAARVQRGEAVGPYRGPILSEPKAPHRPTDLEAWPAMSEAKQKGSKARALALALAFGSVVGAAVVDEATVVDAKHTLLDTVQRVFVPAKRALAEALGDPQRARGAAAREVANAPKPPSQSSLQAQTPTAPAQAH